MLETVESIKIGFVPGEIRSSVAFPVPRILRKSRSGKFSRDAVQACPAVNGFERRTIEILAPFSLSLHIGKSQPEIFDFFIDDQRSPVSTEIVSQFVAFMPRETWRRPDAPVIQISVPYFFVCDQTCYLTQMPAWASPDAVNYPGQFIGGRFPTDVWPRGLNLSFEWSNHNQPFEMKRGQPACYLYVETASPVANIELVAARATQQLDEYRARIADVVRFTGGTFGLFEAARIYRPDTLLTEITK